MKFVFVFVSAIIISGYIGLGILNPAPALADLKDDIAAQSGSFAGKQGANLGQARDPRAIAADIIRIFLGLVGTIAIAYTVYAGYMIMTAGGNEEQITKGKKTLTTGIVGIVIILSAYSITRFVAERFATGDAAREGTTIYIEDRFDNAKMQDPLYQ